MAEKARRKRPRDLLEKLSEKREAHLKRGILYRGVFVVVGLLVVVAGLAMAVLPGPAFVVVPLGLSMLAMEFDWAERLLYKAVEQGERAQAAASRSSPRQRALVAVLVVIGIAAFGAWAALGNIPLLPEPI